MTSTEVRSQARAARSPATRLTGLFVLAALALALLAGGIPAEAGAKGGKKGGGKKGGGKELRYQVIHFRYQGNGDLNASRETAGCVAGETARWGGGSTTTVDYLLDDPGLHPLSVGKARLKLGRGAGGKITVKAAPTTNRFVGLHHLTTRCFLGSPSDVRSTPCNPADFTSKLFTEADIAIGRGGRVEISWSFRQGGGQEAPDFVPPAECGGEAFRYPGGTCESSASLRALKREPRIKLRFGDCKTSINAAPNTDAYLAFGFAGGFVQLKRIRR